MTGSLAPVLPEVPVTGLQDRLLEYNWTVRDHLACVVVTKHLDGKYEISIMVKQAWL